MFHTSPHLRCHVGTDGAVILDLRRGIVTRLNATGSQIWAAVARGESLDDLSQSLSAATGQDSDCIANDLRLFLEQLQNMGLITNKLDSTHEHASE